MAAETVARVQLQLQEILTKHSHIDVNNKEAVKAYFTEVAAAFKEQSSTLQTLLLEFEKATIAASVAEKITVATASATASSSEQTGNSSQDALLRDLQPQPFEGTKDGDELDTWIFQWDSYFTVAAYVPESSKMPMAGMNLKGQAATWFRDICEQASALQPGLIWPS